MATYLSQPYQGSEFVSGVPIDLITKVALNKQLKYEQTVADVQASIDEVGAYDIIKDSEKQYVDGVLSQGVNKLNQIGGGNDLSDSVTSRQLKNYVSDLKRDPRLYNAISDTRKIRNNLDQLNQIKDKHPNYYSQQNEAIFMKGINDYLNGPPGTRYTGDAYIPYYNYDEAYRKIAEDIRKNPDTVLDIQYATLPDGTRRARSTQEVKQVTKEKIQEALLRSNDPQAIRQMQIDYQAGLANKTVVGAIDELRATREDYLKQLQEAKDLVAQGISDPQTLTVVQSVINNLEGDGKDNAGAIKQIDGKIAEVRATQDPTKYYSFDKFAKDFTGGLSRSLAFEQRGKIEYDDMFKEDYKFQHDLQLEQVKSSIKLQEEKLKGTGAIDLSSFTDSFTNSLFNIEDNPNRESNMDNNGFRALFDGTQNNDGTMTISLSQGETFLDLGQVAKANGIEETNSNKLRGLSSFTNALAAWNKTNEGQKNIEEFSNSSRTGVVHRRVNKTIEEYLETPKGKALAAQVKNQTGLDVTNAQDRANLQAFASSEDAQLIGQFGNALSKLRGQVAVRPMNGSNLFAGNDGQYYGKMQGLFTQSQLETALGEDGDDAFERLVEKGIIEPTLNEIPPSGKREAIPLYSLPMTRKVEKDISSAYTNYMTGINSGDNFYTKNLPGYQDRFRKNFDAIVGTRGLNTGDLTTQGQLTLDGLAKADTSADGVQKLNWLRNEYNKAKTILDSGIASSADKINAKKFLQDLITNSQRITTFTEPETPTTSTTVGPRQPGQTVAEYTQNPGNLKWIENNPINRLYGGTNSGVKGQDGGTFTRFPDLQSGYKAYQAQLFGPSDGLFKSNYYQPTKTVDQALRSYSNYRTENGTVKGYNGDIYPEIKNKKLQDLTKAERDELTARMLKIENGITYQQLVDAGVINT